MTPRTVENMLFDIDQELNRYLMQNDPQYAKKAGAKSAPQDHSNFVFKNKVAFYNP